MEKSPSYNQKKPRKLLDQVRNVMRLKHYSLCFPTFSCCPFSENSGRRRPKKEPPQIKNAFRNSYPKAFLNRIRATQQI